MEFLFKAWTTIAPLFITFLLLISTYFLVRISQKHCNRMLLKIFNELKSVYTNRDPFLNPPAGNKANQSKLLTYASFTLSTLISIFIACFVIGAIMIYAISETLAALGISFLPSFFVVVFDWIIFIISALLLVFAGIYVSKITSHYIHKLSLPHSHLIVQIISTIVLAITLFLSYISMGSTTGFFKFSMLIVAVSIVIALILPVIKWNHRKVWRKNKTA